MERASTVQGDAAQGAQAALRRSVAGRRRAGRHSRRLLAEPKTLGLFFESLVVRDLRIYSQAQHAAVYHYRDSDDLEVDAVVARDDGLWLAVEVKLNHSPESVDQAARNLHKLRRKVAPDRRSDLAGMAVVTARGPAYRRPDGIQVVPATALGP